MIRRHGVPSTNTTPAFQRRVRIEKGALVTVDGRAGRVLRRVQDPYFRRWQVIFPDGTSVVCHESQLEEEA